MNQQQYVVVIHGKLARAVGPFATHQLAIDYCLRLQLPITRNRILKFTSC